MSKSENDHRQTIVLINPYCHQGQGWKRWLAIKDRVIASLGHQLSTVILEQGVALVSTLETMIRTHRPKIIISAGGDGTVHTLVNAIMNSENAMADGITVGAVGLGSSNDFLKPFGRSIENVPVRLNVRGPVRKCDVGLIDYMDENNHSKRKHFIVNASLGVTASANWAFNHPDPFLRFLKSVSTSSAIVYTAIRSILEHKNTDIYLMYDSRAMDVLASNINILKIPYVSGQFRYNQSIKPDDGKLGLNICRDMGRLELLKVLSQLSRGKFMQGEKAISELVSSIKVHAHRPVVFECDGETALASEMRISVIPQAINILTT